MQKECKLRSDTASILTGIINMKFADVPELEPLLVDKPPAIQFTGVQCDSRRVRPGDIFVAVTGGRDDGAKYGTTALAKGAVAIVSEVPLRR